MKAMVNPFQLIADRLADLGIFSFFLPWLITAAVFWGLLKKSGIFGSTINAILSLSVSFFLWGYLISAYAVDIGTPLSIFITQGTVFILVFLFGLVAASMFYPKFGEVLTGVFKGKLMIWIFMAIFFGVLFFTSGLHRVLIWGPETTGVESDVGTMVIILIALIVGVLILVGVQRAGGVSV